MPESAGATLRSVDRTETFEHQAIQFTYGIDGTQGPIEVQTYIVFTDNAQFFIVLLGSDAEADRALFEDLITTFTVLEG